MPEIYIENNFIYKEDVQFIEANDYKEVIDILLNTISSKQFGSSQNEVYEVLLKREEFMPTGVGYGVAIPHAPVLLQDDLIIKVGILDDGVNWFSYDKIIVRLVILVLYKDEKKLAFFKAMGRLNEVLKDNEKRKALFNLKDVDKICNILNGMG